MNETTRKIRDTAKLRGKIVVAVAAATLAGWFLPQSMSGAIRAAITWNVGGAVYLAIAFVLMSRCGPDHIRQIAAIEDEARFVFFAIILLAVVSSLYAVFALIADAKGLTGTDKAFHAGLAALTVLISWLVMQVIFTLHYAHDYYGELVRGGGPRRGLRFPGDDAPDYWDFFYFTTSIGATSQTSDVEITDKFVRRMVAFQAVLSFVFNTAVVALAINLASGLL